MALGKLKKLRLMAGVTQKALAAKLKISQPTYQRWESGALEIPVEKRKALAKLFGVGVRDLDDAPEKFDYLGIDESVPADRSYYGEVAIHFVGSGPPLLMPISMAERTGLLASLDSGAEFFTCSSLDNWTVVVRAKSIADLYVSSDACDEYGPEAKRYATLLGLYPEPDFWEIVENAENPEWLEGIPAARIKDVLASLKFDEEVFQKAIASGQASESDRAAIEADIERDAPATIERASVLTWQFSNGVVRKEYVVEDEALANALVDFEMLSDEDCKIVQMAVHGWHRSICINAEALDYIAFPSHRIERGEMMRLSKEVDEQ